MGLYSSAFKAETAKGVTAPGEPELYVAVTLTLPSGTKRWAETGLAAQGSGYFEARIIDAGAVDRAVDIRSNELQAIETTIEITDTDRTFAREVAKYRTSLRRSPATVRWLSPNVSDANAFTAFTGILTGWEETRLHTWRLTISPDDGPLQRGVVPRWGINAGDFQFAHADALGKYPPLVYGVHSSVGLTQTGMVPTLYVNTAAWQYLVSVGGIGVGNVYVDGVLQTSGYSIAYIDFGGKTTTCIVFLADQGDAVVTCDITSGLGGSTNPATQLINFLTHFVWGDWRSGAALPAASQIDNASFTEAANFLDALGHEGSKYIGPEQSRGLDIVNEWANSHELKLFWKNNGTLAVRPLDFRQTVVYFDDPYFVEEDSSGFSVPFETNALTGEVLVNYLFGQADGSYFQSLRVMDLSVSEGVAESRDLPWSAARVL